MQSTIEALVEPRRRQILSLLHDRDHDVGELVAALDASQPNVSKHLKVLRNAGLVDVTVHAQRRVYRLRPEPFRELDDWLSTYRDAWDRQLDALERHLDTMEDQ